LRLRARTEAPGDGFVIAQRRSGAAGEARAAFADAGRRRAESGGARRRQFRQFVETFDARDLFNQIRRADGVAPPSRRLDDKLLRALPFGARLKAEILQHSAHARRLHIDAGELTYTIGIEGERGGRRRLFAGDGDFARFTAAKIENGARGQFDAGDDERGIDAAGEAILRIGGERERAAGLMGDGGIEERALDQNVRGRFRDAPA
jgi:hypothetical protein